MKSLFAVLCVLPLSASELNAGLAVGERGDAFTVENESLRLRFDIEWPKRENHVDSGGG